MKYKCKWCVWFPGRLLKRSFLLRKTALLSQDAGVVISAPATPLNNEVTLNWIWCAECDDCWQVTPDFGATIPDGTGSTYSRISFACETNTLPAHLKLLLFFMQPKVILTDMIMSKAQRKSGSCAYCYILLFQARTWENVCFMKCICLSFTDI